MKIISQALSKARAEAVAALSRATTAARISPCLQQAVENMVAAANRNSGNNRKGPI